MQQNEDSVKIREQEYYIDRIAKSVEVIPETVSQFVTTDKNGKDVFEGDVLKFVRGNKYVLGYDEFNYCFALIDMKNYNYVNFDCDELSYYELIGNKWECEV